MNLVKVNFSSRFYAPNPLKGAQDIEIFSPPSGGMGGKSLKNIIFVIENYWHYMREIEMVDLKAQYQKIGAEIDVAIKSVLQSTAFIKGPDVKLFEEELQQYMGVKHVVSCANGTDALHLAMMVLGLKPGDEVITTNFTFIATVEVVALLGLKLVIVEPDPGTFQYLC